MCRHTKTRGGPERIFEYCERCGAVRYTEWYARESGKRHNPWHTCKLCLLPAGTGYPYDED